MASTPTGAPAAPLQHFCILYSKDNQKMYKECTILSAADQIYFVKLSDREEVFQLNEIDILTLSNTM